MYKVLKVDISGTQKWIEDDRRNRTGLYSFELEFFMLYFFMTEPKSSFPIVEFEFVDIREVADSTPVQQAFSL